MLQLIVLASVGASSAPAEWRGIGEIAANEVKGNQITFRSAHSITQLTVLSQDLIRVRMTPGSSFGLDNSWAVAKNDWPSVHVEFSSSPGVRMIRTPELEVRVQLSPFRLAFYDRRGLLISKDTDDLGMAWNGKEVRCWKDMPSDEQYFGLGEKAGQLDKQGHAYVMWNTDAVYWQGTTDQLYESVPFFIALRQGRAYGIFFDNTYRSSFDMGAESRSNYSFGAEDGELNYYFFYGPDPKKVLERYTELVGRMPLPPRWAIGYHQSRWSYYPESKFRFIADNFRIRHIPCDALYLDIDYMDGYRDFSWDEQRFPEPARMCAALRQQGFRTVAILDPGVKIDPQYWVYGQGRAGNYFVGMPDGKPYEAKVWPGMSVFPDFTSPKVRQWWGSLHQGLIADGVAGFWDDMDEPSIFEVPSGTMDLNAVHYDNGLGSSHAKIHNVYGMLMSEATQDGMLRLRPNERPMVITRATYAGGQRYAAVWTGDNTSTWEHLRISIRELLTMGLSGLAFAGADIGGFAGGPTPELYARWLEAGVFYPYCRTHAAAGNPDQEPWSYGNRLEVINRNSINLRYRLLPYLYNGFYQASRTGLPIMRALLLDYPDDPEAVHQDEEFLFGDDLLVAPIIKPEETEQWAYLPRGKWFDFFTDHLYQGPTYATVSAPLGRTPLFVRGGAIIPTQQVVEYADQAPIDPLTFEIYPDGSSSREYYEDDGMSFNYRNGVSLRQRVSVSTEHRGIAIDISAREGSYTPPLRSLVLKVHNKRTQPREVEVGGDTLEHLGSNKALDDSHSGWFYDEEDCVVWVKLPDRGTTLTVQIME
jgi:alpha-glucosidase